MSGQFPPEVITRAAEALITVTPDTNGRVVAEAVLEASGLADVIDALRAQVDGCGR